MKNKAGSGRRKRGAAGVSALVFTLTLGLSTVWVIDRKHALEALEQEILSGLDVEWSGYGLDSPAMPTTLLTRYSPFTQPQRVRADYMKMDARRLAIGLRHFDGLRELVFGQGSSPEVLMILEEMRTQPSLTTLLIFNVPLDERVLPQLARMRALADLAMVPGNFTGEGFPQLPELKTVDFAYCSLNDAGLASILRCPKLEWIRASESFVTKSGLYEALGTASPSVREIDIPLRRYPQPELEEIEAELRKRSSGPKVSVQ